MVKILFNINVLCLFALPACGLSTSDYHKYDEKNEAAEEVPEEICDAGVAAFDLNIAPALGNCATSGCHGTTPIAGEPLTPDDQTINRRILLKYDDSDDGSKLFEYISGATPGHGGGVQNSISSEQALAWKTAEINCDL